MFLAPYFSQRGDSIAISCRQASHFAKSVAGDFNPIHDEGARKFCVPGDLLFALVVERFGIHRDMDFRFLGTVGADVGLVLPKAHQAEFEILNDRGKPVVGVRLAGPPLGGADLRETLIREYVAFSGQNFPHILVPLMADKGVMINPARPLVMYESMSLHFDQREIGEVSLRLSGATLSVDGKRGDAILGFHLVADGTVVGRGAKQLALGGLMPYDQQVMDQVIADYEARKASYSSAAAVAV